MNFALKPDIESVPRPPRLPQTTLSPLGETMGDTVQPKYDVDKEKIRSETALEVGSNY